jgi:lipopolysaccharide export system permease protein
MERTYVHAARAALKVDQVNSQLRVKLQNAYFETHKADGSVDRVIAREAEPLLIDLKNPRFKKTRASAMTNQEILTEIATNPELPEGKKVLFRAEITKRYSFSMACLSFAFIAVPLGLGSRRRDTSSGLVISLLIGTGYFLITMLAEQFKTDSGATAALWAPNIACVLLGLFLFRRARFK